MTRSSAIAITGLVFGLSFLFSGCTSRPQQVRKMLLENPEIVFDVLENNPDRFKALVQKLNAPPSGEVAKTENAKPAAAPADQGKGPQIAGRAVRGKASAPIKLVVYSDFQCPFCRNGYVTVENLRKKYGDKVAVIFKHFPLDFHPLAMPAAKRYEAIAMQSKEKAFKFHDLLFSEQSETMHKGEAGLDEAAKKAGANLDRMRKDMELSKISDQIRADTAEAQSFGIGGTPGFNINGVIIKGARPEPDFEQAIDSLLAKK